MPPKSWKSKTPRSLAKVWAARSAIPKYISRWATRTSWSAPIAIAVSSSRPEPKGIERRCESAEEGRSSLPDRRVGLSLSRLSCAASADAQIRRPADRRGVRLLQHGVETARGHARRRKADAPRGRVRRRSDHLSQQTLRQVQGKPTAGAGRPDSAIPAGARRDARLRHSVRRTKEFRGRRSHR